MSTDVKIPAFEPVWLVTQGGFLPHGLMLPPGGRALFQQMHLCPVYTSEVVAAFVAQDRDDPWILSAEALLVPISAGTSILGDMMTRGEGRLARWAQVIAIKTRVRQPPVWSAAKRVDTAIVAALERIGTLPPPPTNANGEYNWFTKDEHRDDRLFVDWADRFFVGGDSNTEIFDQHSGFSSAVATAAALAAKHLLSGDEREADQCAIQALEAFVGHEPERLARACQIIDETFETVPQRVADAARRLGGGVVDCDAKLEIA